MPEKPLALSLVCRKSSTSLDWEKGLVPSEESSCPLLVSQKEGRRVREQRGGASWCQRPVCSSFHRLS